MQEEHCNYLGQLNKDLYMSLCSMFGNQMDKSSKEKMMKKQTKQACSSYHVLALSRDCADVFVGIKNFTPQSTLRVFLRILFRTKRNGIICSSKAVADLQHMEIQTRIFIFRTSIGHMLKTIPNSP